MKQPPGFSTGGLLMRAKMRAAIGQSPIYRKGPLVTRFIQALPDRPGQPPGQTQVRLPRQPRSWSTRPCLKPNASEPSEPRQRSGPGARAGSAVTSAIGAATAGTDSWPARPVAHTGRSPGLKGAAGGVRHKRSRAHGETTVWRCARDSIRDPTAHPHLCRRPVSVASGPSGATRKGASR